MPYQTCPFDVFYRLLKPMLVIGLAGVLTIIIAAFSYEVATDVDKAEAASAAINLICFALGTIAGFGNAVGAVWIMSVEKLRQKSKRKHGYGETTPPSQASFDEVWQRLRPFMGSNYDTQQAIIVMDGFGWIDNGPCTCGLKAYGDPCPHHDDSEKDQSKSSMAKV